MRKPEFCQVFIQILPRFGQFDSILLIRLRVDAISISGSGSKVQHAMRDHDADATFMAASATQFDSAGFLPCPAFKD